MKKATVHKMAAFVRARRGSVCYVVVEPYPLSSSQRLAMAARLEGLTAFISRETPDPMPVAFFDPAGERREGEKALIAVFRALALSGRTIARRVLLDTVSGIVPVQEEVFRRPTEAQVWIEVDVPGLEPDSGADTDLQRHLGLAGARAWRSGPLLLVDAGGLKSIRGLDPGADGMAGFAAAQPDVTGLLAFTTEAASPFADLYVRHFVFGSTPVERDASVVANAALGALLWRHGTQKTFLAIDQGPEPGATCRVSVWIEGEGTAVSRVSVGGQVIELERIELEVPGES